MEVHSEVHLEVHSEEKSREQHVLEEQPEQNTKQLHLEEKNLEVHLEVVLKEKSREEQVEQSLSQVHHLTAQDLLNRESQSHVTEYQSYTNEVSLEQSPGTKENDLFGSKSHQAKGLMNQKLDDINSNMQEDEKQDEDGNENDCKPAARVKSQDDDDVSDYQEEPRKKKRWKESFSLGCEVL